MRGLAICVGLMMLAPMVFAEELLLDPATNARSWPTYLGWEFPGATGTSTTVKDPQRGSCVEGKFDFAADSRYAGIIWYGKIAGSSRGELSQIGFYVKLEDRDGGWARFRDSSGQELVANFSAPRGKWKRIVINMAGPFNGHWQGANDGKAHFPITAVLVAVSRGPDHARLRVSDLFTVVDKVAPADRYQVTLDPGGASGVLFAGQQKTVACTVSVLNRVATDVSGALAVTATEPDGHKLVFSKPRLKISGWHEASGAISLPAARPAYWKLSAHFTDSAGARSDEAVSGMVMVPRARHYGHEAPNCYFGLQSIPNEEVAERLGAKTVRLGTGWRWIESRPGHVDWAHTQDPGVNDALKHHMQILYLLQTMAPSWASWKVKGKPKLAGLVDPAKMNLWEDYCRRTAEHYRGKIAAYELANEPDLTCAWAVGLPQAEGEDYYAKLLKAGYAGIKAGDPGGKVAGIDVSGGDFDGGLPFTAAMLDKAGKYVDLYTAHPYSGVRYFGPDQHPLWPLQNTMNKRCEAALNLLAKHGKPRHMWIGELGWGLLDTSDPLGSYSMDFAACMAQALVVGKSVPGVDKFLWFTEWGCNEGGYWYGLLRGTPAYPLPAAMAYSTCAWVLDAAKPVSMKRVAGELWRATFACQKRHQMIVVWFSTGDDVMLRLPQGAPKGIWWTSMYQHPAPEGGRYRIGRLPVYWVVPLPSNGREPAYLSQIRAEARVPVSVDHVYVAQVGATQARLGVYLTNKTSSAQHVTVTAGGKTQSLALAAGARASKAEVNLPLALPIGKPEDLNVAVAASGVKQVSKLRVNLTALPKPPADFHADGDVAEWAKLPGFDLRDRHDVLPADPGVGWDGPNDLSMKAWLAADARGLYFAAAVTDDVHYAPNDAATNFWGSDSIQLAIDPTGDTASQFDADDREVGFVLGQHGPRAFETYPAPMRDLNLGAGLGIKRVGHQTIYEVFLPWKTLRIAAPKPGQVMAIDFIANDNDGRGRAYWMGLTPGIGEGKDAGAYRRFVFEAK